MDIFYARLAWIFWTVPVQYPPVSCVDCSHSSPGAPQLLMDPVQGCSNSDLGDSWVFSPICDICLISLSELRTITGIIEE